MRRRLLPAGAEDRIKPLDRSDPTQSLAYILADAGDLIGQILAGESDLDISAEELEYPLVALVGSTNNDHKRFVKDRIGQAKSRGRFELASNPGTFCSHVQLEDAKCAFRILRIPACMGQRRMFNT